MKKFDLRAVLRDVEDRLIPRLNITLSERAAYYHLLRLGRLEERRRVRISLARLAWGTRISQATARYSLWGLVEKGAARITHRSQSGHDVELLLPAEIPECRPEAARAPREQLDPETADYFLNQRLAGAIHRREGGRCFYCRRELRRKRRVLDHVVPRRRGRWKSQDNSYRNLVSCCSNCNLKKSDAPASHFLRRLYREGQLSPRELADRLGALRALARGQLKPTGR